MLYDNDRILGLIRIAAMALAAVFMLTACEKTHTGDTTIINIDDESNANVEINKNDPQNNDNDNANQ